MVIGSVCRSFVLETLVRRRTILIELFPISRRTQQMLLDSAPKASIHQFMVQLSIDTARNPVWRLKSDANSTLDAGSWYRLCDSFPVQNPRNAGLLWILLRYSAAAEVGS